MVPGFRWFQFQGFWFQVLVPGFWFHRFRLQRRLEPLLLLPRGMRTFVPFTRRFLAGSLAAAVLFCVTPGAEAQSIGFQGGVTVDPEQGFVGTHFETPELFRNFRFRPGLDGAFGGDFSLATLNIEFLYYVDLGRSNWAIYQGGGPAVVFLRQNDHTRTHAGSFFTFGFTHENGFFTDFKIGNNYAPTLKFTAGYTVRPRKP